jgi:hypothetical protein
MSLNATVSLFREHSASCGGVFGVDAIVRDESSFRLSFFVENTGEQGDLRLMFDSNRAYGLDAEQAAQWTKRYPQLHAQGATGRAIQDFTDRSFGLIATGEQLPITLHPGERWEGWLESARQPLPDDIVALFAYVGPFAQAKHKRMLMYVMANRITPFLSLGEPVEVAPSSGLALLKNRTVAILRVQWAGIRTWSTFWGLVGVFAGIVGGQLLFSSAAGLALGILGGALGLTLPWLARWYLADRKNNR